ncbi:prepilin-type N-terminal cleavage/methylation domain-containing protein [Pseudoalteromonas sp. GutCa3]|uniref:prepilin-type N-terminal cleavage/methylation domain-containing protein n=1 Tax=Pseudoalteromonas sp. GutCa3 TaxID=888433 RepID=UPI000C331123|nr:prepilin-type N-terminal cleavage/methylation domain-containing protein [Pseudoalteromonas sp. GutCa3]PKG68623.1 hypothetical protein CXF64_20080 [Pseudoalteromonas sp. GutCa3]
MILKYNSAKGFSLLELIVGLVIVSGLLAVTAPQYLEQEIPLDQINTSKEQISSIKGAANSYFLENREWPSSIQSLVDGGYLPSNQLSPFGTDYSIGINGKNLVVSVDTNREKMANMLAGNIAFGNIDSSGEIVSTEMGTPSREAIQSFFLARKAVAGCPECNQLSPGTNLDINNNDLININNIDAKKATIENATIENASIDELDVEKILLGNNSISYDGDSINLNAGNVVFNGLLTVNGDIDGNGNNITGFDLIEADDAKFTSLVADDAVFSNIEGETLTYENGVIDELRGDNLDFDYAKIKDLRGNVLNFATGTIDNISGDLITYSSGSFVDLTGDDLDFSNGNIDRLRGDNFTFTNVNSTNGYFEYLEAQSGIFNGVAVSGTADIDNLNSNSAVIDDIDARTADIDNLTFSRLDSERLDATNANLAEVDATNINANFLTTGSFSASSLEITNDFSIGGKLTATYVDVLNQTTTNILNANTSSLGNASATNMNVADNVTANKFIVNTLTANSGDLGNATGSKATFTNVEGSRFNGGRFTGDNFTTSKSSVNNNKSLIDSYILRWNECKSSGGCQ